MGLFRLTGRLLRDIGELSQKRCLWVIGLGAVTQLGSNAFAEHQPRLTHRFQLSMSCRVADTSATRERADTPDGSLAPKLPEDCTLRLSSHQVVEHALYYLE